MSGPMALEPGGTERDTLALRLADDRTLALRMPDRGVDPDAVDLLAAELADRVGPAVHPYEVAALLESEGLTGEVIQERYGHPDLFSLASALYERVPRTYPEPAPPPDPWRPDHLRCALRGALFALPGLAYLLTGRLWHAERDTDVLIAAGLASWAWGQALGHRAFLRMTTGRREAGRTLLKGAPLGAVVATAAGSLFAGSATAAGVAAAQSVYLAAAGVLLVLAGERLLLAALVPVIAGAAALPWWEPGTALRAALPLLSLAGAVAAAAWMLRSALAASPVPGGARPPVLRSLPYGLFGLAAGVLVLVEGHRHPYAVIVLTVSMGPAEWLLYKYRGMSVAALRAVTTPAAFLLRSAGVLALCLLAYLLPLLPAARLTDSAPVPLMLLAAALWTALLLQAFGMAWPPAAVCLTAAAGSAAATVLHRPPGDTAASLCCGAAALCLAVCALRLLGRPAAHA
ncbi:hypothetical protein [Streptomyces fructofermentans]|uniref:Integral membrane protein n=1 Tax=Streptomyces fructofermentans TaxID=152141 RepID=A0A918NP16_9ACTN|nr:hypothetical protein [Streptomyces fructofermentans]GGX84673.1 hypothetical protein GCM10010515_60060 [Streptomyces fructofermentans]